MKNEKIKILVVDDIKENCEYLEILLKDKGYKVFSAENGKDALEKLNEHNFDLIISDILMPVMDGYELCRRVKKKETLKDIPFVFYTGSYISQKDENFAFKLGVAKFLIKPLKSKKILKIVKEIIEDKESFKCNPSPVPNEETAEIYKLYNERLINKLEKKNLDLDKEICERKIIEEKLKKSEEKYRRLTENAKDIIYRMSLPDGKYEYISPACFEICGHTSKEFYDDPKLIEQIIHPDFMEEFKNEWAKLIEGKMPPVYEYKIIDKSGKTKWLNQRNVAIKDEKGKLIAIEGLATDITVRKKAEKKIQQQNEFLQTVLESIAHPFYIIDAVDYKIIKANSATGDNFAFKNATCYSITHNNVEPCQSLKHPCPLEIVKRTRKPTVVEHIHFDKDGNQRIFEVYGYPIFDENEKVIQMIEYCLDITDRKQAEDVLRASEEKYRLLFNLLPYGGEVLDTNGNIVICSDRSAQLLGYEKSELIGKHITKFLTPDTVKIFHQKYPRLLTGKPASGEICMVRKDGTILNILRSAQPILDSDDKVEAVLALNIDITNRKKAEEKLISRENYLAALNKAKEVLLTSELENINTFQQFVDILGPASKASRTYIFLNHTGEKGELLMSQKVEYCAPGIKPEIDNPKLQNLRYDEFFEKWREKLSKNKLISGKIKNFPKNIKKLFEDQDIKAVLIIPIIINNNFIGFLGCDNCTSEREWDEAERNYLHSAAQDLAQYIVIKKEKENLLAEHKRFVTAMNSLSETVSVTDIQTHEILFANNHAKHLFGDDIVGKPCWQVFRKKSTNSCDSCGINRLFDENGHARKPYNWDLFNPKTNKWYSINDQAIEWIDGRIVRLSMATDITDHKLIEENLKHRENYLAALNEAKEVLLVSEHESENTFQQFVDILGHASKASRTYIFLNHTGENGKLLMSQKAEYCASGINPEIDNPKLQNLKYNEFFKRWRKTLSKGELIFGKIKGFPKGEKEFLMEQNIKAVLIIPIVVNRIFIGFIGYDNCISEREWDEAERNYLLSAAQDLAQFIVINREKEKLLAEHNRFMTVMDSLDAVVYVTDMKTYEILFVNNYTKQLFDSDIIGKICWQTFHDGLSGPCDFCTNDKLLDKNGSPNEPYNWEFFNKKLNKWYAINDQAIKWVDGRIVRMEIATDITSRKEAEKVLAQRQHEQSLLLNSMPYPIMLINKKRKILALNDAAKKMEIKCNDYCWKEFGKCESLSEKNKIRAKNNPDNPEIKCTFCQADKMFENNEIRNDPKVESFGGFFDTYWVPLDKDLFLHYAIDVTDKQKATEKLDKYARTQEVLLREVNHRVKNNLYALMGMLNKEKNLFEKNNSVKQSEFIDNILLKINSLSTVHSLLSASKWQPINLANLCRELIEPLVDSIALNESVVIDIAPTEVKVSSNQAHHITIVINEIITNAIKYALPKKETLVLKIEIKSDGKNIIIKIKDNGEGFQQPILDGNFENIGIGFDLIFGIVKESLGGEISIENNNGAVFNITFKNEEK